MSEPCACISGQRICSSFCRCCWRMSLSPIACLARCSPFSASASRLRRLTSSTTCSILRPTAVIRKSASAPLPRATFRPFAGSASWPLFLSVGVFGRAPAARRISSAGCFSIWQRRLPIPGILKRIALVDVLVLSGLYTLRLLAGSAATQSHISHWLAGFSVFLFFSLAIVKRFAELQNLRTTGLPPRNGRGYLVSRHRSVAQFRNRQRLCGSVVFAIYISGSDVIVLYRHAAVAVAHHAADDSLALPRLAAGLARRPQRRSPSSSH